MIKGDLLMADIMEVFMSVILLIYTSVTIVTANIKPCSIKMEKDGRPLPQLDKQFTAVVEAKILQKSSTVVIREYYDFPNNRGAVYKTKEGSTSIWLYNFQRYESFQIEGGECTTTDMKSSPFNFFQVDQGKNGGHIVGVVDLFNFGTKYNETFVKGNRTIRGIPVNQWTSCILMEKMYDAEFRLDYYFSTDDYRLTAGRRSIPIRAVLNGVGKDKDTLGHTTGGNHTFSHIYDFVSYEPGPIKDETVFEVPKGVVCRHKKPMKERPVIPSEFTLNMEEISADAHLAALSTQYFDYKNKMVRLDATADHTQTEQPSQVFGYRYLKTIHDYNTGLEYVDAGGNCTVRQIPSTGSMFDGKADDHDQTHVKMRHGYEIMDFNKVNFSYSGQRNVRGIPCDVWAGKKTKWPHTEQNTTIEIYFTKENWTSDKPSKPVLVGIWKKVQSQKSSSEYTSHIFGFASTAPDLGVFDISSCYEFARKHLTFQIPGTYQKLVYGNSHCLRRAVVESVSKSAGISPIRISQIHFEQTSSSHVDVWFTILEKATIKGSVSKPVLQISLEEAHSHLVQKIESGPGLIITVQFPNDSKLKHLKVLKGSLKTDKESLDPRGRPIFCSGAQSGYSSGSMAGLGIAMLIIGAVVGVVAAFFMWKRGSGIAYQVYN